jgi:hypothetical protein
MLVKMARRKRLFDNPVARMKHKTFDASWTYGDYRPRVECVGINKKTAYISITHKGKEFSGRIAKSLAKQLLKDG